MAVRTCRLVTLGCKVNQYETQLVKEALEQHGYREAEDGENADLCVVNTCTVTSEGDSKSRKTIRHLARENPGTRTLVMGCYATRAPEEVKTLPSVFEVVTDKRELPDILLREGVHDMPKGISTFDGRKRAYVKVQDGCILKCTYCIIPKVRPGLRSRSPQDIEDEVRRLIDNGHKEIVIAGIHVGHYGVDNTRGRSGLPPFRLWHLFRKLDRIPGDWRMRLSSIEANEIGDDFISAAADCEHLCPQFHPGLQSGSDSVLIRMRRRYRMGRFLETLDKMRNRIPDVAFTTDVIVGFPGETEAEFEETLESCRRAEFMKIHVFPFSARRDTPAATFAQQVSPEVRKDRVHRLSNLERELAGEYYARWLGRPLEVLVERLSEDRPGWVRGTDRCYIPVECPGTESDVGRFVTAIGDSVHQDFLQAVRERRRDHRTNGMNRAAMQSRFFRLDVDADVATVEMLRDRLTEEDNIEEFGQELTSLVDKQNFKKIIVCMRSVRYLTSSVIGKLIMLHRRLGRSEGQLVLTDVQPEVEEILEAGQLMSYFKTAKDVGAAKGALA